jgi:hypothetical protein
MTVRDSRRIHNWRGSRKQLERERNFGKAIVSSSQTICQKSRRSGRNCFLHKSLEEKEVVRPVGFESTSDKETKEFCGAAWPSKVLKGKRGNP